MAQDIDAIHSEEMSAVNEPAVNPPEQPATPHGVGDVISSAWSSANLGTSLYDRFIGNPKPDAKPVKGYDQEVSVPKGYEPWASSFIGSQSPQETEWLRNRVDQEQAARRTISAAGWWGVGAVMAAGALDPFTIASMAIAPEATSGRIAGAASHALTFGATSAAQELAMQQLQLTRTPEESLTNIAASSVLGGVLGAIIRPRLPGKLATDLALQLHADIHGPEVEGAHSLLGPESGHTTIVPQPDPAELNLIEREVSEHLSKREAALKEQAEGKEAVAVDFRGDQGEVSERLSRAKADLDTLSKPLMEDRNTQIEAEMDRLRKQNPEAAAAERAAKGETQATVQSLDELKAGNDRRAQDETIEKITAEASAQKAAAEEDRQAFKRQLYERNREGTPPWEPRGEYPAREQLEPEPKPAEGATPTPPESPEEQALRAKATENVQQMRDGLTARSSHARRLIEGLSSDADRARRVMSARSSLSVLRSEMASAKNLSDKASLLPEGLRQAYERRIEQVAADTHITPQEVTQGLPPAPINISDERPVNPNAESTSGAQAASSPTLRGEGIAKGAGLYSKLTGWVSPGVRLLRSPNIVSRQIIQKLANISPRLAKNYGEGGMAAAKTEVSVENKLWAYDGIHYQAMAARGEQFKAYRERLAQTQTPAMNRSDFNEQISKSMRRNDEHVIPEVAQAAKDTRRIAWDDLKQRAIKLGALPADVDVKTADSYLMRQYDQKKITANHGKWIDTLVNGFMKQGAEHADALDVAYKVTRNIQGAERGMLDLKIMDGVVPKSGRLKERTLNLPDSMLEEFLNNNIDGLEHAYHRSLAPEVEMLEKFEGDDRNLSGAIADMHDEYSRLMQRASSEGERTDLLKRRDSDLRDIEGVRDRLYGIYGQAADPSSAFVRMGRLLRSGNATRLLGVAALSHLPDFANVVLRYGLGNTFAGIAKLLTSGDAMKMSMSSTKRLGAGLDMHANTTAALLGDYANHSTWGPQQLANRATRAFTIATGETPLITMVQNLTSTMAQDELIRSAMKVAGGGALSKNVEARLLSAGIDRDDLLKFAGQHQQFGADVNGLHFGMTDKWTDQAAAQQFEAAVRREAHSVTLRPGVADTPLIMSTEMGKTIGQFKSFGFAASQSVAAPLLQGLAHGDPRAAQALLALVTMGTASYYLKQKISNQPSEPWNSPKLATEILDKSNLLGWTGEWIFPMANQLGFKSMSRFSDRDPVETFLGPTAGSLADAFTRALPGRFTAPVYNSLTGDTDSPHEGLRRSDLHFLRKMAPAQNHVALRRTVNDLEDWVGDKFDLPGKSNAEKAEENTQ